MDFTIGSPKKNENNSNVTSQKSNLFSQSPKNQPNLIDNKRSEEEIATITRRLKLLENNFTNLRNTTENLEKNSIDQQKENRRDIKLLEDENTELKETVRTLKNVLKKIADDMGNVARANDVQIIKKYLDLWNPVKFTTPEMVKRIVKDEIDNSHKRQFDSRVESIERDIYQKQELKDQIHKQQP